MPQAVTHILVAILIIALFRDFYLKKNDRKKFPLHYVLIGGIGGVLPDIDIVFSVFLKFFEVSGWNIHKTFTHSIFFPICFLVLFLIFLPLHERIKICKVGKHKLKLDLIFLVLGIGAVIHILLDGLVGGPAYFFYPFSKVDYGLYLTNYLPTDLQFLSLPLIDGILLVVWIVYLELKHKISDFI